MDCRGGRGFCITCGRPVVAASLPAERPQQGCNPRRVQAPNQMTDFANHVGPGRLKPVRRRFRAHGAFFKGHPLSGLDVLWCRWRRISILDDRKGKSHRLPPPANSWDIGGHLRLNLHINCRSGAGSLPPLSWEGLVQTDSSVIGKLVFSPKGFK